MSIKAQKGRSFSVAFNASLGSTPYGWCLTEMPEEVMLYYQENTMSAPMSTKQIFHFLVKNTAAKKEVELKFALVNFTNADEGEAVAVPVEISEADFTNEAGSDKFFAFDGNTAVYNPNKLVLDYAFPAVSYAYDSCAARPPYGVLPAGGNQDCGCLSMMYHVQPQAAFAAPNPPTVAYGVFPSNASSCAMLYAPFPRSAYSMASNSEF